MPYSLSKILSIVIKSKNKKGDTFLFYDEKEKVCCFTYWCYNVQKNKIKLSELIPQYTPMNLNIDYYKKIKTEIKDNGFDYNKSIITIKYGTENIIVDGHHRYFILKDLFGEEYEIFAIKIADNYNQLFHILFVVLIIKPIKLLYIIFTLLKTLIFNNLRFFL